MNADPDVTRVVRSWLKEDAYENADRVLDSVLDQLEWIPQRRAGWLARRFPIMNSSRFRYGIAAAAIVAAAFLGLRFLPGPNVGAPDATPSPTPSTSTFTSERHEYSLLLPDDSWVIVERRGEWAPGKTFSEQSGGLDVADKIGESEPWILITSQPLDVDRDAWLTRYDQLNEEAFPDCAVESSESRQVDGEEGRINTYRCGDAALGVEATTCCAAEAVMFHDDRVYVIRVFDREDDRSYDPRPQLDEFLDIFRFLD